MTKPRLFTGLTLLVCAAAVAVFGARFLHFWMSPADESASAPQALFYEVKPHDQPKAIAAELEKLGAIKNARLFYWYARLTGKSRKFKSGDYRFTNKMRPDEVLAIIMSGISYGVPLVVPEGFSYAQIADALDKIRPGSGARFKQLCEDRAFIETLGLGPGLASLEGYLYPETYLVGRKTPEEEVIRAMVRKFKAVFTPELASRAKELGFTEHQLVTLASIIEKETGSPDDRGKIASVFHNRLKKHMRLQSDPTVIYGIKDYQGKIHKKDLETPTPYNTYTIPALPPGPIASPGKSAIMAALYPEDTQYLYFVSHNDGTSEFTATLADHNKAVAKYQLDPKAREGKSWRDLSKRPKPDIATGATGG